MSIFLSAVIFLSFVVRVRAAGWYCFMIFVVVVVVVFLLISLYCFVFVSSNTP